MLSDALLLFVLCSLKKTPLLNTVLHMDDKEDNIILNNLS